MFPEQEGSGADRLVCGRDLQVAGSLALALPLAWLAPRRYWLKLARIQAGFLSALGMASKVSVPGTPFLSEDGPDPTAFRREYTARVLEAHALLLRHYRPGNWSPPVKLHGERHVRDALRQQRGVVLWIMQCHGSSILSKAAFAEAGYQLHHLSRPSHGASSASWLGSNVLNPLFTAVERRYLAERVVISEMTQTAPVSRLRRVLLQNGIVSITVADWGMRMLRVPLEGDREFRAATGAPRLALMTGAALLPVFTLRPGDGFAVVVYPPLCPGDGSRASQVESLGRGMAALVERHLRESREQLKAWDLVIRGRGSGRGYSQG